MSDIDKLIEQLRRLKNATVELTPEEMVECGASVPTAFVDPQQFVVDKVVVVIEHLTAYKKTVNAFKEGAEAIHKLAKEIVDGRIRIRELLQTVAILERPCPCCVESNCDDPMCRCSDYKPCDSLEAVGKNQT